MYDCRMVVGPVYRMLELVVISFCLVYSTYDETKVRKLKQIFFWSPLTILIEKKQRHRFTDLISESVALIFE